MTRTENDLTSPRVIRGGCWSYIGVSWERAASRVTIVPAGRRDFIGFRTALTGRQPR
jgi:formylglycine-generating enzyme required for sulfatase activity